MPDESHDLTAALEKFLASDAASRHATLRARGQVLLASNASAKRRAANLDGLPDDVANATRSDLKAFHARAWAFVSEVQDLQ